VRAALAALQISGGVIALGDAFVDSDTWKGIRQSTSDSLERYHAANPFRQGMPLEQLRAMLGRTTAEWPHLVRHLERDGVVRQSSGLVALASHRGGVGARRGDADRVLALLRRDPYSPPTGTELCAAAAVEPELLEALRDAGEIVRVTDGLYFDRQAYDELVPTIVRMICTEGEVTVAGVRDALGTSRKYVLALLEHLDAERITRRVGDARVLGNMAPACA
jgi:selenocysteine-specific elongation factor